MTDPYALTDTTLAETARTGSARAAADAAGATPTSLPTSPPTSPPTAAHRDGALRPVLWVLLLVLAAGNLATSLVGMTTVSVALGLAAIGCVVALVVHHRRTRP